MTGHTHELKADGQIFTDAELLAAPCSEKQMVKQRRLFNTYADQAR